MRKVFWIGPIVNNEHLNSSEAVSAAANIWQLNFIKGLIANDIHIHCLTYMPCQSWPKGKFWVTYPDVHLSKVDVELTSTSYLNVKYIRDFWIVFSLFIKLLQKKIIIKEYLFTMTYNPEHINRLMVLFLRRLGIKKWISIVADNLAFGKPDITIFLSYDYFRRHNEANKYFLDGGINKLDNKLSNNISAEKNILLYAGSISVWTGIEEFTIAFDSLSSSMNMELHIYGKGNSLIINKLAEKNSKIVVHGFVSETKLEEACLGASVFVNPRPTTIPLGENNFPSKILMYLSYRKPVLTTKILGISPQYDRVLDYYEDGPSLERKLELLFKDKKYYEAKIKVIESFIINHTWDKKIRDFLKFIQ